MLSTPGIRAKNVFAWLNEHSISSCKTLKGGTVSQSPIFLVSFNLFGLKFYLDLLQYAIVLFFIVDCLIVVFIVLDDDKVDVVLEVDEDGRRGAVRVRNLKLFDSFVAGRRPCTHRVRHQLLEGSGRRLRSRGVLRRLRFKPTTLG